MKLRDKIKWRLRLIKFFLKGKNNFQSLKLMFSLLVSHRNIEGSLTEFGKCFVISKNDNRAVVDLSPIAKSNLKLVIKTEKQFLWDIGASALEIITENGLYECGPVVLRPKDIVIDAGAHLGIFTIFAAYKIGPMGKVYAFEPVTQSRNLLIESVKFNYLSNIQIESFALGDSQQNLEITLDNHNTGAASGVFNRGGIKQKVEQITLDKFIKENNISKIDFIKADIEGMERNLLTGAEETIRRFKPRIAICIYHLTDDPEVLQGILSKLVPEYKFIKSEKKLYAWV